MKKLLIALLALTMLFSFAGCKKEDPNKKSEGVMTYAEFAAAPLDSEVTVETYVQAKQSWWDNKGTFYTQDGEGGYFLYEMRCSEDEYNKLTPGTKIKVKGTKSAWLVKLKSLMLLTKFWKASMKPRLWMLPVC